MWMDAWPGSSGGASVKVLCPTCCWDAGPAPSHSPVQHRSGPAPGTQGIEHPSPRFGPHPHTSSHFHTHAGATPVTSLCTHIPVCMAPKPGSCLVLHTLGTAWLGLCLLLAPHYPLKAPACLRFHDPRARELPPSALLVQGGQELFTCNS